MSKYVEGEEEQLTLTDPLVENARRELAKYLRRPIPEALTQLLHWLARESFRIGHQHAHDRTTLKDNLWPDDEVTK